MTQNYEARLRRVLQHIFDHPDGDLSLDALADVAAMSRFHWHRVYHAMTGETCAQAVRRVRAHRAAIWLIQTDWPVSEVAKRTGYGNVQSFARAFREIYGQTPAAFRKAGNPGALGLTLKTGETLMYDIEIRDLPPLRLAALRHIGDYAEIGRAFQQLATVFTARAYWPHARGMVGIYYDDPSSVPLADLTSDAGIKVADGFEVPQDLTSIDMAGGRHAVLTYKGPYSGLKAAWDHLYGHWLPRSGEELGDAPAFENYLNDPMDVAPADLVTEICAPLASGQ